MRCAVCRARQLRRLGVYLVSLSAYVHTCMDLPGMPGISDQDGFLTVLGTSLGRAVSFFWFHFFSLHWVGARSLDAFCFSFVKEATLGSFASNRQRCSALDLVLFSIIGIPPSHPRLLYFLFDSSSPWIDDVSQYQASRTCFFLV